MEKTFDPSKWFRFLMGIAIASLVNSVAGLIPLALGSVTTWVSRGIMLAMAVCMFQLAPLNDRYRKAGIFRAGMLACALFTAFLFGSMAVTIAASVFSFVAVYQEFQAHAEVVFEKNPRLSRNWRSLFYWEILVGILLSLGATATAAILVVSGLQEGAGRISSIVITVLSIPDLVLSVIYVRNLKKTEACVSGRDM